MTLPNACPKYPSGKTLGEERAEKRTDRRSFEQGEKAKARRRDFPCRWPRCDCHRLGLPHETAHVENKGMGGDHSNRSRVDQLAYLCRRRHQGPHSLHTGHLAIEYQTVRGTDGPCNFYDTDIDGRRYLVAEEDGQPFTYRKD
jgi:hypothetical protein